MKRFGLFAALTSMLLSTSCLFDTRDANPPSTTTGGCLLDTSGKPIPCMTAALAALSDGDYERAISESFVFSPTTADSLDEFFNGSCPYLDWNKDVETQHVQFLVSNNSTLKWDKTTVAKINKNTFVRFDVNYSLLVATKDVPPDTTIYRGVAEIDVRNEQGNWRVTFWNETQTVEGSRTWGYLRGRTRLQLGGGACPP